MKKSASLLVILFAVFTAVSAQAQIKAGVIGCLNVSKSTLKAIDMGRPDFTSRTFPGVGAVLDIHVKNNLTLRFLPMYTKNGMRAKVSQNNPAMKLEISQLELPVLFKFNFTSRISPYFITGPVLSYSLGTDITFEQGSFTLSGNFDNVSRKLDAGVVFGGGLDFPVGKMSLFIEGRFTIGMKNLLKEGEFSVGNGTQEQSVELNRSDELKNKGFQFMCGLTIPLRVK